MSKTIVIGISGGIAAYKILEFVQILKKQDIIDVVVMMTHGATKIVDPKKFEKATNNPVYTEIFEKDIDYQKVLESRMVDHIELAKKANVMVIAPATANMIAKIAHGIADDYITTTILAARTPVIICPSMNTYMWNNPITQENIETLRNTGYIILDPESGLLACGDKGTGRLVDPTEIAKEVYTLLAKTERLKERRIIITAGGTREYIDDVRFIANKSSGKMGVAIAEAAYLQGADVQLVRSVTSVRSRYPIQERIFETSEDLQKILKETIPYYDICFHAAAVSDFRIKEKFTGKLSSNEEITITLQPQEKILNKIKTYNPQIKLIAFKAAWDVSENKLLSLAKKKLEESHAEFVIANDVGKENQGFSVDTNEVFIVNKEKVEKIPFNSKKIIGEKIIKYTLPK